MKLDTVFAPTSLTETPALARAAEDMGFAGLWTAETSHDPYLPLPLVAEHTERIEFGTPIAVAFPRSPLAHAQITWDLAAQSRGAQGDWGGTASEITDEMLDVYAVTARWDEVRAKVRARYDGILDRVALYLPFHPGADADRRRTVVRAFA